MKVNYIHHQIALFERFYDDERLNPTHISLYMALFQYWNFNRFNNPFTVARAEIMKLSKINSRSTYSKCIHQLTNWNYIDYYPSNNPFKGSQFSVLPLKNTCTDNGPLLGKTCTNNRQLEDKTRPLNGPLVVPYKTYKQNFINRKRIPTYEIEVVEFFKKQNANALEAKKFWNHYLSVGWKSGKSDIMDWQASAKKWILGISTKNNTAHEQKLDNLLKPSQINYDEPL